MPKRKTPNVITKIQREKWLLRQEVAMFHQVMEGMRQDISQEDLLKLIVRSVTKGLGYDRAGLFLPDAEGKCLERAIGLDEKGHIALGADEHNRHPLSPKRGFSVLSDIYNGYRDFFFSNNILKRMPGAKGNLAHGVNCNANIPLMVRPGKILGVLAVDNLFTQRRLRKSDIDSLVNFATQTGLALESARLHERIKTLSVTDDMTGLHNRRWFDQALPREILRCQRYERECGLLYADIDHFKKVNDHYGHPAGDEVLKYVAGMLRNGVRNIDTVCRIGGEEFAVILPETNPRDALTVAQRLVHQIASSLPPLEEMRKAGESVTISIGAASFPRDALCAEELLEKSDACLYRAKKAGRNRVMTHEASG